jgi:soluble lytic murein transglycosylase-like protein
MLAALLCAAAVLSLVVPASATDIAVLRNGFTIRHDHRIVMGEKTRLFTSSDDSSFTDVATAEITSIEKDLTPPPTPAPSAVPASFPATAPARVSTSAPPVADLNQVVNSASAAYHLDPDLVNSVIHAESGFNARAISPKGAQGLMQLMPSTANSLGVNNAFNPQQNVGGGSRYLRELLERYNFDLVKALAAYNAGPERVDQYHGVPPFRETRAYVARIIKEYNRKIAGQSFRQDAKTRRQFRSPALSQSHRRQRRTLTLTPRSFTFTMGLCLAVSALHSYS